MPEKFGLVTTPRYDTELTKVRERGFDHAGWHYVNTCPVYMLDLHHDRLLKGAKHFGWDLAVDALETKWHLPALATKLEDFIADSPQKILRLRILLNSAGEISFEKFETPAMALENLLPRQLPPLFGTETSPGDPRHDPEYTVVVDSAGTPQSEHTYFKTTYRPMYDAARRRAQLAPTDPKEVLILDEAREYVTEGSITTPYFWRDGRWVTPPVSQQYSQRDVHGGQYGTSRRWALERYGGLTSFLFNEFDSHFRIGALQKKKLYELTRSLMGKYVG
jgi:hypothetical protein